MVLSFAHSPQSFYYYLPSGVTARQYGRLSVFECVSNETTGRRPGLRHTGSRRRGYPLVPCKTTTLGVDLVTIKKGWSWSGSQRIQSHVETLYCSVIVPVGRKSRSETSPI